MKTLRFAILIPALLALAGCPNKIEREPDIIFIDYGAPDPDTIGQDNPVQDTNQPDANPRDNVMPVDVVEDTGPCTLLCPYTMRCGPNPCGDGECLPGCSGDKPICNMETRQCEPETCQPNCAGKACGYDGCGGLNCGPNNGKCPDRLFCNFTTGQCEDRCYPACTGKACGDDGCGKICPPGCAQDVECHADGYCVTEGQCQSSSTELKCQAGSNSGSGSTAWKIGTTTMSLFNYSAACGSTYNPGPEKAFKLQVAPYDSGVLEVEISQSLPIMAKFLNVYLVEDTGDGCVASACVAWGDSDKSFQYDVPSSPTGHKYYLIADSDVRNDGMFSITIKKCGWNGFDDDAVVESSEN